MIATIADEDTVIGFKLAGVDGTVFTEESVKETLDKYKEAKILILTEKVAEHLRSTGLMDTITATIAEIPDKTGSTGAVLRNIAQLFEEAIGVQLK